MNILTVNDNVDWSQTKMRVMAVAVALFFAYLVTTHLVRPITAARPMSPLWKLTKKKGTSMNSGSF